MPSQRIPCSDCADKTVEIELGGRFKVTRCAPIAGDMGWCLIVYERVTTAGTTGTAAPDVNSPPK